MLKMTLPIKSGPLFALLWSEPSVEIRQPVFASATRTCILRPNPFAVAAYPVRVASLKEEGFTIPASVRDATDEVSEANDFLSVHHRC
jgi:hypothetical protein